MILGAAPPPSEVRRAELAEFLRHRRALVSPANAGLEANGRRRTPGLRREEVAQLAGVLDALARTLRLDVRVIGDPQPAPDGRRNLLRWLFASHEGGGAHWRETGRHTLARFRAEHARRIGDPDFAALIEALEAASAEFRAEQLGTKTIDHPELGTLRLHHIQSVPTSHPDLRLTQFAPADDATRATLAAHG